MKALLAPLLVAALVLPTLETPAEARGRGGGGYRRSHSGYHSPHRVKAKRKKRWRRAARWAALGVGAATLVAIGAAGAAALTSGATLHALTSGLNVRSTPSTRGRVIDTLAAGEAVSVVEPGNTWVRVETAEGLTGWVHADHLGAASEDDEEE